MAQPPQACAPCPAHYAVLQGAYARYTNTLIVLERALYLAHANARTLLVDTQAMFPNNSKITQKYNPGTRSLADILQVEPFRAAWVSTFSSFVAKLRAARGLPLESSVLYWPPLPGAPRGVPPQGASFWATCNSAAAHKRCVVSEGGKRASVAIAYNKPECSGL